MATRMYFTSADASMGRGNNDANERATAVGWYQHLLSTSRGSVAATSDIATVAGLTPGVEWRDDLGLTGQAEWISEPLAAAITIAGAITANIRCRETAMTGNAGPQIIVHRLDRFGAIQEMVTNTEHGVEMGTSEAAHNFAAIAGVVSDTAFGIGERIRVKVLANDAGGTMATGTTCTLYFNGPTADASGDSWIEFTEDMTFLTTAPSGSVLYLTDVASPVSVGTTEKALSASRDDGVATAVKNTAAGWAAPSQWTDSAGGTAIEWYTVPLQAVTLEGLIHGNLWIAESAATNNAGARMEIATCEGDGSSVVTRAAGNLRGVGELPAAGSVSAFVVASSTVSITDGQRIRLRIYQDDMNYAAAAATGTNTISYGSTSGGVTGDSYITFSQTLSEYAPMDPMANRPTLVLQGVNRARSF